MRRRRSVIHIPTVRIHTRYIAPGQTWSELRRFGDDVTVIAHDTANGRVRVRRAGGQRDVFMRARTLHRGFRLVSP